MLAAVTMSLLKFEKSSPPPQPPQTFPSQVYRVRQDELGQADHVTGLRFVLNGMHFAGILDSGAAAVRVPYGLGKAANLAQFPNLPGAPKGGYACLAPVNILGLNTPPIKAPVIVMPPNLDWATIIPLELFTRNHSVTFTRSSITFEPKREGGAIPYVGVPGIMEHVHDSSWPTFFIEVWSASFFRMSFFMFFNKPFNNIRKCLVFTT
jgi:hypothetical protein